MQFYIIFLLQNGKEIEGKRLDIVNLISSRSKDRLSVYVKNFPKEFTNEELSKLFSKYGDVSSAVIALDDFGNSRGFGFVTFCNSLNAAKAIKELKESKISFPGMLPLFADFPAKKEDRTTKEKAVVSPMDDNVCFIAVLMDPELIGVGFII